MTSNGTTLARHLDGVNMSQLVRRNPSPNAGGMSRRGELDTDPGGRTRPTAEAQLLVSFSAGFGSDPDKLTDLVAMLADRKAKKLSAAPADEKHLFVWLRGTDPGERMGAAEHEREQRNVVRPAAGRRDDQAAKQQPNVPSRQRERYAPNHPPIFLRPIWSAAYTAEHQPDTI
jgi:hypothetical protein